MGERSPRGVPNRKGLGAFYLPSRAFLEWSLLLPNQNNLQDDTGVNKGVIE